ncbi:hypothetical protein SAMN03159512_03036 [Pseudomonas sp. NFR09]|nr:hypothetical protein SAMN03159512_03036 [Pseudomonas sp. NFR09]VVN81066.1 hypothetical protein PS834_01090 [Pseudomonas fluorescens]
MTGCECVQIPYSLHQSPRSMGFLGAEKRAQLVLGPLMRLQR